MVPAFTQTLSVAYISAFILVYMVTLFPMGGHYLVAKDFVGPDVEHDEALVPVNDDCARLAGFRRSDSFREESDPELQRQRWIVSQLKTIVKSTLTPASLSMIISIPIALVPSLKGLFTATTNSHIPYAPDGEPPLAFILDFASFMGAASVPLGLICLGYAYALARLRFVN
ncbi:hypothetical protein DFJ43DRAFT_1194070 [Lentinula guzmanii]|uniref:Uncharacterized protein n=1 Tax=Lentinula guzmanii TaxID=2804957 RepID=A0AA38JG65_9AGAR|nr:hypothetical protein DFJ43DRAFT_1194070 [Lentinula guzmanii]